MALLGFCQEAISHVFLVVLNYLNGDSIIKKPWYCINYTLNKLLLRLQKTSSLEIWVWQPNAWVIHYIYIGLSLKLVLKGMLLTNKEYSFTLYCCYISLELVKFLEITHKYKRQNLFSNFRRYIILVIKFLFYNFRYLF